MVQKTKNLKVRKILLFVFIFILTLLIMQYSPAAVRYLNNHFK